MFKVISLSQKLPTVGSFKYYTNRIANQLASRTDLTDKEKQALLYPVLFTYTGPKVMLALHLKLKLPKNIVDDAAIHVEQHRNELSNTISLPKDISPYDVESNNEKNMSSPDHPIYQQFQHLATQNIITPASVITLIHYPNFAEYLRKNKALPLTLKSGPLIQASPTLSLQSATLLNLCLNGKFSEYDSTSKHCFPDNIAPTFIFIHLLSNLSNYVTSQHKGIFHSAIRHIVNTTDRFSSPPDSNLTLSLVIDRTLYTTVLRPNMSLTSPIIDPHLFYDVLNKAFHTQQLDLLTYYSDLPSLSDALETVSNIFDRMPLTDTQKTWLLAPLMAHYTLPDIDPYAIASSLQFSPSLLEETKAFLKGEGSYLYNTQIKYINFQTIPKNPTYYFQVLSYAIHHNRFQTYFESGTGKLPYVDIYTESLNPTSLWTPSDMERLSDITISLIPTLTPEVRESLSATITPYINEDGTPNSLSERLNNDTSTSSATKPKRKPKPKRKNHKRTPPIDSQPNSTQDLSEQPDLPVDSGSISLTVSPSISNDSPLQFDIPSPQDFLQNLIRTTFITPLFKEIFISKTPPEGQLSVEYRLQQGTLTVFWNPAGKLQTTAEFRYFNNPSAHAITIVDTKSWVADDDEISIEHVI